MSTLSVAERKKYRERQKQKQGVPSGSTSTPVVVPDLPRAEHVSPTVKSPSKIVPTVEAPIVISETSGPRPPPSQEVPIAKKQKTGARIELGLPHRGEGTIDVAWKDVLKCRKRADGLADAPIRSTFDSKYPLNTVLNASAGMGDVERVATLGIQQTLVAVKSYGHYASVLAHLAEDAINKTIAKHSRLEEAWKKTGEELTACKAEKAQLEKDLEKWDAEKLRLEERVSELTTEKGKLAANLERVTKELEEACAEVARSGGELKRISGLFPDLAAGSDLAAAVDEVKPEVVASFDKGFEMAFEELKVLYPEADVAKFDFDKIVVNGQIVDEGTAAVTTEPLLDLAAVDAFLSNDEVMTDVASGHALTSAGDDREQTP